MELLSDIYIKLSKYVKANNVITLLLVSLFIISLKVLEKYKEYNFYGLVMILRVGIVAITLICIYLCFQYISNSHDPIVVAISFCFIYFCGECILRQIMLNFNINQIQENIKFSPIKHPFILGLIFRPIIILYSINVDKNKFLANKGKSIILIMAAVLLAFFTSIIEFYVLLPIYQGFTEQQVIITYLDTILVNLITLIVFFAYYINTKSSYFNLIFYNLLIPIFIKYYIFYSDKAFSVYTVAAEILLFVSLILQVIYYIFSREINIGAVCYELKKRLINIKNIDSLDSPNININRSNNVDLKLEDNEQLIFVVDLVGRIQYVSKSFSLLLGFEENKILRTSFLTITHPADTLKARVLLSIEKYDDIPIIHRIKSSNGEYIWMESTTDLVKEDDEVTGKLIVSRYSMYKSYK